MRIRSSLIVALATAATAAFAASPALAGPTGAPVVGSNGNSQSIGSVITPKKLFPKAFSPAALEVTTKLSTSAPSGVPNPTTKVVVDFDKNAKIFAKGVPTCNPSKLQSVSTEVALQQCGKAKIGSGKAEALLPVGDQVFTVHQTVTAFNGVPKGKRPVVLLHSYGTTPIQTALVLNGVVSNYNKQGYGPRLDVTVPLIAGGAGALTYFNVKIDRKFTYKGKKRSFITARCPQTKKLKTRSVFTFLDGVTTDPTYVQKCTPKAERKRK